MKLHKEGNLFIGGAFVLLVIIYWLTRSYTSTATFSLLILTTLSFFLIVYFFRKPNRIYNKVADGILSPCDGKVVVIEEVEETEFFNDKRIQISVFMSPLNVHINWHPIAGKVLYAVHHPGKFYKAWLPKASKDNENATVVTERKDGVQILYRQIAGAMARRIVTYAKPNDKVGQGEELGFIKFGSRMDIFVPLNADIQVKLGEKVKGLQSILAVVK